MAHKRDDTVRESGAPYTVDGAVSPFKTDEWRRLSPAERLSRAWRMRSQLKNLAEIHDRKLFPKP